jgi:hypothetical protein
VCSDGRSGEEGGRLRGSHLSNGGAGVPVLRRGDRSTAARPRWGRAAWGGAVSVTAKQGRALASGDRRRCVGWPGEKENGPGPRGIVPFLI